MSCKSYHDNIALAVEDDLDAAAAGRLAQHLEGCADCRALAVELRASQRALHSWAEQGIDSALLVDIRAGIAHQLDGSAPPRRTRYRWLAVAAVLLAALLTHLVQRRPAPPAAAPAARVAATAAVEIETQEPPTVPTTTSPPTVKATADSIQQPPLEPRKAALATLSKEPPATPEPQRHAPPPVIDRPQPSQLADHTLEPTTLRWILDDPPTVIYWQIDPSPPDQESKDVSSEV